MKALTFTLKLLEPLLIANPVSGDENSATGLNFIPGSVIRGALAHLFSKGKQGDLADKTFKRLFFGDTRFLNGYLRVADTRSLPTPCSWYRPKDSADSDPVIDLAVVATSDQQLKLLKQPFAVNKGAPFQLTGENRDRTDNDALPSVVLDEPNGHLRVHILQNDRMNAVQSGSGTVFRYEAMAAGQEFSGAILSDDDDVLNLLSELLKNATLKLGKSRSAGYGSVQPSNPTIESDWREYTAMHELTNHIVVTLLSDVILRNRDTGAFASDLAPVVTAEPVKIFAKTHAIGGFNLTWGLPLTQAQAIQAGSVFVFECSDTLAKSLRSAETDGIGERRIDGYGRIAINWHTAPELKVALPQQPNAYNQAVPLTRTSAEHDLAQQMVDRIWRSQLDVALRYAITQAKLIAPPRNTQLSRMRTLVNDAWRAKDAKLISKVLQEAKKEENNTSTMKRHARDQFARSTIQLAGKSTPLLDWLTTISKQPERVWQEIQTTELQRPEIGGVVAQEPLSLEYAARLIEGIFRKATREGTRE